MFEFLFTGIGFAFAAALQPGPLQAFLFSKVNQKGWKATLPASFAPVISDGPIALLILTVLNTLSKYMIGYLQAAGGLLLIYFAISFYIQNKNSNVYEIDKKSEPRTLMQAVAVNLINPNPYLGWSLVLGPLAIKAWHAGPVNAFILIGAFYFTMTATLALTIFLFGTTKFLNDSWQKRLITVSYLLLFAVGIVQLIGGIITVI